MGSSTAQLINFYQQQGKEIARRFPEIAQQWKGGKTQRQLAQEYLNLFEGTVILCSKQVAQSAICYALQVLLSKRVRAKITYQRRVAQCHQMSRRH